MQIGRPGPLTTSISTADAHSITVREKDLCSEVMGQMSFTEYFYLLVTGDTPTEDQRFFLDLLLNAIAEHGLVPTNQVARMTYAAAPDAIQGAVAAGILGCGSVVLGTAEECGKFLEYARTRLDATAESPEQAMASLLEDLKATGGKAPGFGHPLHKPVDPRARRILELAETRGVAGLHCAMAKAAEARVPEVWGKPLPMNVSMAIAAVLLDLGFPKAMLKAIPILARTGSLLAHLNEESTTPIGFTMAAKAESAVSYEAK
ncbi:citryl-CoA lyase [Roseovarius tibetensis]|uniref:citryl-CoA lyase n=1 Tax=Roseovarius tibetensis TaxID=2685897 RepID=UPI003D7FC6D9